MFIVADLVSLNGGCTGSSESIHIKMPHCWKSHVTAHFMSLWKTRGFMVFYVLIYFPGKDTTEFHQTVLCEMV